MAHCHILAQPTTQAAGCQNFQKPWKNPFSFPSDEVQGLSFSLTGNDQGITLVKSYKFLGLEQQLPTQNKVQATLRVSLLHSMSEESSLSNARGGISFDSIQDSSSCNCRLLSRIWGKIFFPWSTVTPSTHLLCFPFGWSSTSQLVLNLDPEQPKGLWDVKFYLSHCTSRRALLSMQFQHLVWEVQNTEPTILNALLPTVPISVTVLRHCSSPDTCLCPISSFRKSTHLISFLNLETFMFGAILQHLVSKNSSLLFWNAANTYGSFHFYSNTYINLK